MRRSLRSLSWSCTALAAGTVLMLAGLPHGAVAAEPGPPPYEAGLIPCTGYHDLHLATPNGFGEIAVAAFNTMGQPITFTLRPWSGVWRILPRALNGSFSAHGMDDEGGVYGHVAAPPDYRSQAAILRGGQYVPVPSPDPNAASWIVGAAGSGWALQQTTPDDALGLVTDGAKSVPISFPGRWTRLSGLWANSAMLCTCGATGVAGSSAGIPFAATLLPDGTPQTSLLPLPDGARSGLANAFNGTTTVGAVLIGDRLQPVFWSGRELHAPGLPNGRRSGEFLGIGAGDTLLARLTNLQGLDETYVFADGRNWTPAQDYVPLDWGVTLTDESVIQPDGTIVTVGRSGDGRWFLVRLTPRGKSPLTLACTPEAVMACEDVTVTVRFDAPKSVDRRVSLQSSDDLFSNRALPGVVAVLSIPAGATQASVVLSTLDVGTETMARLIAAEIDSGLPAVGTATLTVTPF